jgi:calcineurin-like phosphoesterase family protein
MSKVYFCSDWHLGHRNILKYRPQYKTIEEHDQHFIDTFNKTVTKRDTVFFLGDIAFTEEGLEKLSQLRYCRQKILVAGNHDYLNADEYLEYFDDVLGMKSYKSFWLSHCPIHHQELRNRKANIHGHLHGSVLNDPRYFDVCPEKHNYQMVDYEEIKAFYADKNFKDPLKYYLKNIS